MQEALKDYKIEGIKTNIPMLIETISHDQFLAGSTTTDFVEKYIYPKNEVTGKV